MNRAAFSRILRGNSANKTIISYQTKKKKPFLACVFFMERDRGESVTCRGERCFEKKTGILQKGYVGETAMVRLTERMGFGMINPQ
jgi:hypothetical protein